MQSMRDIVIMGPYRLHITARSLLKSRFDLYVKLEKFSPINMKNFVYLFYIIPMM